MSFLRTSLVARFALVALWLPASAGAQGPLFDDTHGEGLWVRGADYKARFSADGLEFIPFLGSQAPRNFPLHLRLESARAGSELLTSGAALAPARSGHVVSVRHGRLLESFQVEAHSLEQIFHLERAPSGADLVVRLAVETELSVRTDGRGLLFEGPFGGVRYGEVTVLDERRELLRTPPRWVDGGIEIHIPAATLGQAHGALTIDPLISTFAIETGPPDDRDPDVVRDASLGIYAVVWKRVFSQNDTDAHGKLLDSNGNVVREFLVDVSTEDANAPQIAGIEALDQFLVAYRTGTATGFGSVNGRILELAGGTLTVGPPVSLLLHAKQFAIGGDATDVPPFNYLVAIVFATPQWLDYKVVDPSGQPGILRSVGDGVYTWLDGPSLSPSVANPQGMGKRWTLACKHNDNGALASIVCVAEITPQSTHTPLPWPNVSEMDGGIETGGVSSRLEGSDPASPSLVTWTKQNGAVRARLVRGLAADEDIFVLHTGIGAKARVATDGGSFVVTYVDRQQVGFSERIRAKTLTLAGSGIAVSEDEFLSPAGEVAASPAIAAARTSAGPYQRYLAAWSRITAGDGDIVGARYDSPGPGQRYCVAAPNSVGPGARIDAGGSIRISSNTFRLEVQGAPPSTPGIFYLGQTQVQLPFGEGLRCIAGQTARIFPVLFTNSAGEAGVVLDFGQPYGSLVQGGPPGICYQFWYRDPAGGPVGYNLSDALRVQHTP